jgi:hypothetical protein
MKKMSTAETVMPQSSAAERTSASGASVSVAYNKGKNGYAQSYFVHHAK